MLLLEDRQQALEELARIVREAGTEGWDGYHGRPVSREAIDRATLFIQALPGDLPRPEISAEPDGEIGLEWFVDNRHRISVSLGAERRGAFAGISGSAEWYGAEEFSGQIPLTLIHQIRGVLNS